MQVADCRGVAFYRRDSFHDKAPISESRDDYLTAFEQAAAIPAP